MYSAVPSLSSIVFDRWYIIINPVYSHSSLGLCRDYVQVPDLCVYEPPSRVVNLGL